MPELKAIGWYNRVAMRAANQGRTSEALLRLALAMRLAREADRPLLEALSKNNMGIVYQLADRPREAAACFKIALGLARDNARRGHPLCRAIQTNLDRLSPAANEQAA